MRRGGRRPLGLDAERDIAAGLESFAGVGRRLEVKGEPGGVLVIDDYGHHPTAIAATIAAVRERYPGGRLWAVYEPLTYHRTAAMLDAFAAVLGDGRSRSSSPTSGPAATPIRRSRAPPRWPRPSRARDGHARRGAG